MEYQIEPDESVTVAVVKAVGFHEEVPVESLPALDGSIDTDLDELFDSHGDWTDERRIDHLAFEYMDYYVTIDSEGSISLERKPENPFAI